MSTSTAVRTKRSFARGILMRPGTASDLPELHDIDDDASVLFEQAGLHLDLPEDHEFVLAERSHWRRSLAEGTAILATDLRGHALGFAAVTRLDDQPYLAQLSVRRAHMRKGIGSALLYAALDAATIRGTALWLTTYDHLPWNRAFYECLGFVRVEEHRCGQGIRSVLELERRVLPMPDRRLAMRKLLNQQ